MLQLQPLQVQVFSNNIRHGFFGRNGGVSTGIYTSLNCGLATRDDPQAVVENRRRVAAFFGQEPAQLVTLYQCHSPDCVIVRAPFAADRPQADALATDQPGLVLGVLTADCGPVLFEGTKADGSPVIGAAHAGWGGALGGVLEDTVRAMLELGALLPTIRAAVGPCIGSKSYEVSSGFDAPFVAHNPEDTQFFKPARAPNKLTPEKLMFDLPGYIAARLARAGVRQVVLTDVDTKASEADYFSYRRATLAHEPDYGREISAIIIN